jgi:hypothetical protein
VISIHETKLGRNPYCVPLLGVFKKRGDRLALVLISSPYKNTLITVGNSKAKRRSNLNFL